MWRVYLLEFIIVLIASLIWADAITKSDWNDDDDIPFP